jgi:hypothetical protein
MPMLARRGVAETQDGGGGVSRESANEPPSGLLSFYESSLDFGRKTQAEHSKWLINTLYLLHSGAIAGIVSRVSTDKLPQFVGSLKWFVFGLALAFLAGLATWSNYEFFNFTYSELIKRIRYGQWIAGDLPKSARLVAWSSYIALALGLASFFCLIIGAFLTLAALP